MISYNAVVSACEKGEDQQWVFQVSTERRQQRIKPTVISYNALVSVA